MICSSVNLDFLIRPSLSAGPESDYLWTKFRGSRHNDTSGLFQNVFTLDPRTYGVEISKRF